MFTLQIQCESIEHAERVLEALEHTAGPAPVGLIDEGATVEAEAEGGQAIRAALQAVQRKYGADDMAKPIAILQRFGAGRITEVKPEDYAEFIAACEAA